MAAVGHLSVVQHLGLKHDSVLLLQSAMTETLKVTKQTNASLMLVTEVQNGD